MCKDNKKVLWLPAGGAEQMCGCTCGARLSHGGGGVGRGHVRKVQIISRSPGLARRCVSGEREGRVCTHREGVGRE